MRIALLTIGNPLRGDDGVAEELGKLVEEKLKVKVFYGGNAPENVVNQIRKYSPDLLIVVDAVVGIGEGEVHFFELREEKNILYTTHNIPVYRLIQYLKTFVPKVLFLGIGIDGKKALWIKEGISENSQKAVLKAFELLEDVLGSCLE